MVAGRLFQPKWNAAGKSSFSVMHFTNMGMKQTTIFCVISGGGSAKGKIHDQDAWNSCFSGQKMALAKMCLRNKKAGRGAGQVIVCTATIDREFGIWYRGQRKMAPETTAGMPNQKEGGDFAKWEILFRAMRTLVRFQSEESVSYHRCTLAPWKRVLPFLDERYRHTREDVGHTRQRHWTLARTWVGWRIRQKILIDEGNLPNAK